MAAPVLQELSSANTSFLSRLSRKTSTGRFIPEIDGLRFIAIAMVVLTHFRYVFDKNVATLARGEWLEVVTQQGKYGVHLFFVISGLILGLPFAAHYLGKAKPINLRAYYLRRVTRLEPPYIAVLTLLFLVRPFLQPDRGGFAEQLPHYLASLFYMHNIIYGAYSTVLSPAWSLEVEVQFYVLVPLLALLFRIRTPLTRRLTLLALAGAAVLLQQAVIPAGLSALTLLGYLQFFLMGFLLADVYLTTWKEAPARNWVWDGVALLSYSVVFVAPFVPFLDVQWYSFFSLIIFVFYFSAFKGILARWFVSNPWISTMGGMCYTIYLIHAPLMTLTAKVCKRLLLTGDFARDLPILAAVYLPVLAGVAVVLFMLIERPCMEKDWPRRLLNRVRGAPPRPAVLPCEELRCSADGQTGDRR